ncbi:MAG TPA: prolipoprotein diacylglyceryl transferase [Cyclobacteriaceae bacterium]|nr:prolipoprotein diacylglyceryl transferase [Cyclobacteriaceae bacterium]
MQLLITFITWNPNPDIYVIPGLDWPIRWYGFMWAMGLIVSQQVMYYIFKAEAKPIKDVDTLTLYILIATLLGARLGHFLFYDPSVFITDPLEIILPPYSGLASHGAAAGILIGLFFFCRKLNYNYLWMVDRLVIVVCITGGFIRLGNLLNSEILGKPTNVPWAFIFERVDTLPRHPAQLYEAIYCFLLFTLLFYIWKQKRDGVSNGFIFGVFLVVLWSLRFVDEFFKEVQEPFEQGLPLNMGQILSIPLVIAGIIILIRTRKKTVSENTQSTDA